MSACADWTVNPPSSHAIAGCQDAVRHLHDCCPAYASYISCRVLEDAANSNALPDLTEKQSRCILQRTCPEIEATVTGKKDTLCDFTLGSKNCH